MNITKYFCAVAIFISPVILASPKITVSFGDSNGFVKSSSPWISATDKQFNYQNFSTWCDYLEIHPKYKSYQIY